MFVILKICVLLIYFDFFQTINTSNIETCSVEHDIADDEINPIIELPHGQIQGLRRETSKEKTFYSFKGIPYAEPPVGELRFRDPVPIGAWTGIRSAIENGNICPQIGLFDNVTQGDEDCLILNVYTPNISCNGIEKYPVVVYIHGGGFAMGSGYAADVSPELFLNNDIILVTMNYRLNIFGFLSLDIPEVPGNAALKDMHLAIKWVNENINHFNGDVNNISLYGLSAGSAAVEFQLLHSKSQGLFQRASMQSGAVLSSWSRPRNQEKSLEKLAKIIESSNDPQEILNSLSSKTTEDILLINQNVRDIDILKAGLIFTAFGPVVEKSFPNVEAFMTKDPLELYKAGDFMNVPSLITFCRDEGNSFPHVYGETLTSEIMDKQFADFMSFVDIPDKVTVNENLITLYSAMNVSEADETNEFLSDLMFVAGINQALKYIIMDNTNNHYSYMFSFVGSQENPIFADIVGSPHRLDMFVMFLPEDSLFGEDLAMKKYMETIHIQFIKYGIPSAPNTEWGPITKDSFSVLNIDGENNQMGPFPFGDRMNYWDTLFV